jgi:hypothetical protein
MNCIHNYPWYAGWDQEFSRKGAVIIGVHTPETEEEARIERVRSKVKDNGMRYPIAVDGSKKIWKAWENQFWPSIYLIDKMGNVRYHWDGVLKWNETRGERIMRKKIEDLLAEKID